MRAGYFVSEKKCQTEKCMMTQRLEETGNEQRGVVKQHSRGGQKMRRWQVQTDRETLTTQRLECMME